MLEQKLIPICCTCPVCRDKFSAVSSEKQAGFSFFFASRSDALDQSDSLQKEFVRKRVGLGIAIMEFSLYVLRSLSVATGGILTHSTASAESWAVCLQSFLKLKLISAVGSDGVSILLHSNQQ